MKKRILVLVVGFLFVGINVFAADGDLIVNGNATVNGTLTVQGIKLTHVTGTNPTCPSGTGIFLMRKWAAKTCSDPYGWCPPNISCTTTVGWSMAPITCVYVAPGVVNGVEGCYEVPCTSDTWTEAICMGN